MKLIISLIIPLAIGFAGSTSTASAIDNWYPTLNKPFFTPPNWLFGPVWTLLYIMMGISFYLLWKQKDFSKHPAILKLFILQLALNGFWSPVFFGARAPLPALVILLALWAALLALILRLRRINRTAALLLIPYLVWVSYAGALNAAIVWLN